MDASLRKVWTFYLPVLAIVLCGFASENPVSFFLGLMLFGVVGFLVLLVWVALTGTAGMLLAFLGLACLLIGSMWQGHWALVISVGAICLLLYGYGSDHRLFALPESSDSMAAKSARPWYASLLTVLLWVSVVALVLGMLFKSDVFLTMFFGTAVLTVVWSLVVYVFSFFKR